MLQVPGAIQKLFKSFVWSIPSEQKTIYLTFDDGPHPGITLDILDLLDTYHAKATFFCVGENVSKYPELFAEIKKRGHTVGNHTYNHLKGIKTATKAYLKNVEKANKLIQSNLFRPPYGRIKWQQARKLAKDYRLIMWSLITYDYDASVAVDTIVDEIKKKSKSGAIILFHDSLKAKKNVASALPLALKFWQEEGYTIEAISY